MTRETTAAVMAMGTGLLVLSAVALFALVNQPIPSRAAAGPGLPSGPRPPAIPGLEEEVGVPPDPLAMRGRGVYQEQRCSACHSIAGEGSPRYPLDGVGSRLSEEEIRLWIVDPQQIRPRVRKPAYDDLPEEQVAALVHFMATLTAPEG
jgi:mono/diheme cytochrome c family protein